MPSQRDFAVSSPALEKVKERGQCAARTPNFDPRLGVQCSGLPPRTAYEIGRLDTLALPTIAGPSLRQDPATVDFGRALLLDSRAKRPAQKVTPILEIPGLRRRKAGLGQSHPDPGWLTCNIETTR
jgi:hypothetical protein